MLDFWHPHSAIIGRRAVMRLVMVHHFARTAFWLLAGPVNDTATGWSVAIFAE